MSKSKKLPAFQFYPGDWFRDVAVRCLTWEERGIWLEMLFHMHECEQRGKFILNGKAMSAESIALVVGLDNQKCNQVIERLLELNVASRCKETGALMSRRMVRDENLRQTRKKAGEKGGNPNLVKVKDNRGVDDLVNQKGKQSATPSSSISSSIINPHSPPGGEPDPNGRSSPKELNRMASEIYEAYPKKVDRRKALQKITQAFKGGAKYDVLLERTLAYAQLVLNRHGLHSNHEDWKYVPHAATWYHNERWECSEGDWSAHLREGRHVPPQEDRYDVVPEQTQGLPEPTGDWRGAMARKWGDCDNRQPWEYYATVAGAEPFPTVQHEILAALQTEEAAV